MAFHMLRGGLGNVVLAPVSELLSRLLVQVAEAVLAAKDVLIEKESFSELARYLEKFRPILKELRDKNVRDTPPMRVAVESLERELKAAKELINTCTFKSRFYLLMNCRAVVKQIQDITNEIGRCLSLIPIATLDISVDIREKTVVLQKVMLNAQFKAAVKEEEIVDKINSGVKARQIDSDYANEMLLLIARAMGVPVDPASLKQELDEFKKEKEEAQLRKSQAEAMELQQIIAFLSQADAAQSVTDKESIYQRKRSIGGTQPLPPLQSFFCPIAQEIMEDPVGLASGQTFERRAIENWFSAGNRTCPITKAGALSPLVQILEEKDREADEAALDALATLLHDDTWAKGANAVAEARGIGPIIKLLTIGSAGAQEKAVWILERIFRNESYRLEYGHQAQMPLIDLAQKGTPATRSLAAKILAYLQLLQNQSSYF